MKNDAMQKIDELVRLDMDRELIVNHMCNKFGLTGSEVLDYLDTKSKGLEVYEDAIKYVEHWCKERNFYVTKWGTLFPIGVTNPIEPAAGLAQCMLDYEQEVLRVNKRLPRGQKVKEVRSDSFKRACTVASASACEAERTKILASISFDAGLISPIGQFVELITGESNHLHVAVLNHFIWQVKRKLLGRKTYYHMMPVIIGSQGCGKSMTMKDRFLAPMADLLMDTSVEQYVDEKFHVILGRHAVAFLDEMQKADSANLEALKRQVTAENNTTRVYHTQTSMQATNMTTPIGTANKRISEMIKDPTGMRRFWEIVCLDKDEFRANWEELAKLDYLAMWKAVDENKERGYVEEVLTELEAAQAGLVVEDPFEMWYSEVKEQLNDKEEYDDVYNHYKEWTKNYGHMPFAATTFSKKIALVGWTIHWTSRNGEKVRMLKKEKVISLVKENSLIDRLANAGSKDAKLVSALRPSGTELTVEKEKQN